MPSPEPSFFPGNWPALRSQLEQWLEELRCSILSQAWFTPGSALILGGGYGRGEGGILLDAHGEPHLYNDLEFFLFLGDRAQPNEASRWAQAQSHAGESRWQIEVEFKILPRKSWDHGAPTLFFFDLASRSHLVAALPPDSWSVPERYLDPALVPPEETTRLLFNRGSGLHFASSRLKNEPWTESDRYFVQRNQAKAALALGDAVLAGQGLYHWSCRERAERLQNHLPVPPPLFEEVRAQHITGVAFKLHPQHPEQSRAELIARQHEITHLWLQLFLWWEGRRLHQTYASPEEYLRESKRLLPHVAGLRAPLLHLRDLWKRGGPVCLRYRDWWDYPRAPLQRALVATLAELPPPKGAARWWGDYARWWGFYN